MIDKYEMIRQRLAMMHRDGILTNKEAREFLLIPAGDVYAARDFCKKHMPIWRTRTVVNETAKKKSIDAVLNGIEDDSREFDDMFED